jgi:predicted NAD/FAD-dependent oxidoreductase
MRILVIGAGLAGLTAARRLQDRGHTVVVVDKGRAPGGRMATRRILDDEADRARSTSPCATRTSPPRSRPGTGPVS